MEGASGPPPLSPERTQMAKHTFKNDGGGVLFHVAGADSGGVRVEAGETVTTENEELKTAFRKSGQFSKASTTKEKK